MSDETTPELPVGHPELGINVEASIDTAREWIMGGADPAVTAQWLFTHCDKYFASVEDAATAIGNTPDPVA